MNPRSLGVGAGSDAPRSAAATPLASAGPDGPPANGLPQALSARPQYAIAQVLSAASTAPNARSPSSHQNECSTAIACSNPWRALAVHETGNTTRPSWPTACWCSCSCPTSGLVEATAMPRPSTRRETRMGIFNGHLRGHSGRPRDRPEGSAQSTTRDQVGQEASCRALAMFRRVGQTSRRSDLCQCAARISPRCAMFSQHAGRVRRVPCHRWPVGPSAVVSGVRPRRVL